MILHLADDQKFIDHVIDMFESALPNNNLYFIELVNPNLELKYVQSSHSNIMADSFNSDTLHNILKNISNYEFVIFHNLHSEYKQQILRAIPDNIVCHWMCWGVDLYRIPELRYKYSAFGKEKNKTKSFNKKVGDYLKRVFPLMYYQLILKPKGLAKPLFKAKKNYSKEDHEYKQLFGKIKTASTVTVSDQALILKHLNPDIKFLPFKYITIEGLTCNHYNETCNGDNILIGNSATRSNLHFDLIELLKLNIKKGQIIYVPLSYGDEENGREVIRKFTGIFGNQFKPLTDFLAMVDYYKILRTCRNVLMNHKRQQAVGNIVLALWLGANVYLNKKNPVYMDFKKMGLRIFTIGDYSSNRANITENELLKQRKILMNIYGRRSVIDQTASLCTYLK